VLLVISKDTFLVQFLFGAPCHKLECVLDFEMESEKLELYLTPGDP